MNTNSSDILRNLTDRVRFASYIKILVEVVVNISSFAYNVV